MSLAPLSARFPRARSTNLTFPNFVGFSAPPNPVRLSLRAPILFPRRFSRGVVVINSRVGGGFSNGRCRPDVVICLKGFVRGKNDVRWVAEERCAKSGDRVHLADWDTVEQEGWDRCYTNCDVFMKGDFLFTRKIALINCTGKTTHFWAYMLTVFPLEVSLHLYIYLKHHAL